MLNQKLLKDSESILKSLSRLKKGKSIDLKQFVAMPRYGISGISTGRFGKYWFVLPKGKALFKVFDGDCFSMPRSLSLVNELVCSQLARQISLPCADYELAKHGQFEGLVSYNLLKDGENAIDIMYPELSKVSQEIDGYIALGTKIDKQEVLDNLFRAMIFQLITLQTDVKTDGFVFAQNIEDDSIRFAGIVDNEFAFNIQHFSKPVPNDDAFGLFGKSHKVDVESVIKEFDICADFRRLCMESNALLDGPYLTIFPDKNYDFEYMTRVKEICKIARTNAHAREILTQVLSSLDTDKAFEQVEKSDRVSVNDDYKTYVKSIIEYGKNVFEKELCSEQS